MANLNATTSSSDSRPPLSVMALRDKIVSKIQQNRVTLIVGDTGCGKSSRVPQFLLEENIEPILCTQPRRFAVVAIAKVVAEMRQCEVGDEVGYHIGHANVSDIGSERSKIVFKTAGVVLEQIRDMGIAALKYKVIILDEVHERSVESDLLLTCIKQFMMRKNDLRVVMMSATADISRYRDYFKDLGRGERVEVIAIPSSSQHCIFQRKVLYLEQVTELLGLETVPFSTYCPSKAAMNSEVHMLIHKLILHIHENEQAIEKSILVFLPTYHSLEKQWLLLKDLTSLFKIHVLHRSIGTNEALLAMRVLKSHRKVILATNIAESSVTIPGVAYVIDSCRCLQVFWDPCRKSDSSELVWLSHSQAEQRKGRTGRTCDGQIYRLVTQSFYRNLSEHEFPAILRLSLRQQVLMICCASSKAINDPKALLQKLLDPPGQETVEDALSLLVKLQAMTKSASHRGRYEPTFYGRLLDSLPLSFDASVLILKFGEFGLLREGILLGILMDVLPLPISQPFGDPSLFAHYLNNYFGSDVTNILQFSQKEMLFIANLCAVQFWDRVFKGKQRLERLEQVVQGDKLKMSDLCIHEHEKEWCSLHNLVPTSLHSVYEIYEEILHEIHRFRPRFLAKSSSRSYPSFTHTCHFKSDLVEEINSLTLEEESLALEIQRTCTSLPYVSSHDFQANFVAQKLRFIIKEMRVQYTEADLPDPDEAGHEVSEVKDNALCRFFINGSCNKGNQCYFSHSLRAKRPACKFYLTLEGCRHGDLCFFSHENGCKSSPVSVPSGCLQEEAISSHSTFLQMLPNTIDGVVLILNDDSLFFSRNLARHYNPSNLIVIGGHPRLLSEPHPGFRVLWDDTYPYQSLMKNKWIPWKQVKCAVWFADVGLSDASEQQLLLQTFFECLAVRILAEKNDIRVIVVMNNIRFAQLKVEKLARESFFFLCQSFPFDESSFRRFSDPIRSTRPDQMVAPISYIFKMSRPDDIQFGSYAADLQRSLYS